MKKKKLFRILIKKNFKKNQINIKLFNFIEYLLTYYKILKKIINYYYF